MTRKSNTRKSTTLKLTTQVKWIFTIDNNSDLKTATSMILLMDGSDEVIHKIINGIEFYSTLFDAAGKVTLASFVLKTRLNPAAQLKLTSTYTTEALM